MIRYHKLKIRNFKCAFTKTTPKINLKKRVINPSLIMVKRILPQSILLIVYFELT